MSGRVVALCGRQKIGARLKIPINGSRRLCTIIEKLPAFPRPPNGGMYYIVEVH